MSIITKALGLTAISMLAACSGMNYAMEQYGDIDPVTFIAFNQGWRVFDKPEAGLIMITPTLGDAAAAGAAEGATLWMAGDMNAPAEVFQGVAQEYLDERGDGCRVTSGRLVVKPQYEFNYSC